MRPSSADGHLPVANEARRIARHAACVGILVQNDCKMCIHCKEELDDTFNYERA